jgi:hypothetical protein
MCETEIAERACQRPRSRIAKIPLFPAVDGKYFGKKSDLGDFPEASCSSQEAPKLEKVPHNFIWTSTNLAENNAFSSRSINLLLYLTPPPTWDVKYLRGFFVWIKLTMWNGEWKWKNNFSGEKNFSPRTVQREINCKQ